MKYALLAIAALALSCLPASALTNVSSCGSLSGDTQFKLTSNLSSASTVCLEVSGISGTSLDIDCDGHSITMSGSGGLYPLYIHGNNGTILWHGCTIYSSTYYGYGSGTSVGVFVTGNYGNNPLNNWGPSTWSYNNYYVGGRLIVEDTDYFTSLYDTFTNSCLTVSESDYIWATGDTVNNSGLTGSSGEYQAGFHFLMSNHIYVSYGSVTGHSGVQGSGGNVDDGVDFQCDGGPVTAPTTTCVDANVDHLTAIDMYDAGVEFVGNWSYATVTDGTYTRPVIAGIVCFGYWTCSMDHGTFTGNYVTPYNSNTALVSFTAHSTYGGFFTYNEINNNTLSGSGGTNHIGYSGTPWGTVGANGIANNQFGSGSFVYVQGTYGFSDNGSNYCSASSSVITCN